MYGFARIACDLGVGHADDADEELEKRSLELARGDLPLDRRERVSERQREARLVEHADRWTFRVRAAPPIAQLAP